MKKIVGLFICMLLIITVIPATGNIKEISTNNEINNKINPLADDKWMKLYDNNNNYDRGFSTQQTSDGGYIVLGVTGDYDEHNMDFWLIKTDSSGNKLWDKTFGGDDYDYSSKVIQTNDGGYVLIGNTCYNGPGNEDIWLIKTDSEGNKIWDKIYGGLDYDVGNDVKQTNDGGFILIGHTSSYGAGKRDVWLIKTDSEGNKIWDKTFGGTSTDGGYLIQQTNDNGYILLCETEKIETLQDIWLIKTDSNGEMQWNKTFGGPNRDYAGSLQQTADGGYIVLGSINKVVTFCDIWLIKTDSNGEILWDKTFPIIGDNTGRSIQKTSDGGYIILGDIPDFNSVNALLIKTDSSGVEMWRKSYGGPFFDVAYSIQQTTDGGYILTGEYSTKLFQDPDLWLVKTDENGNVPNNFAKSTFKYWMNNLFPNLFKILEKLLDLN